MNELIYSPEIEEFLLQSGMHPDLTDLAWQTGLFRKEMRLGLASDASSLPMLPTYLTTDGVLPAEKPVLVIDMGGTNLRLARIVFPRRCRNGSPCGLSDARQLRRPYSRRISRADG